MKKDRKRWLPASTKIAAVEEYTSGHISLRSAAKKYNVSHVTIINWVNSKDALLCECQDSAKLLEGIGEPQNVTITGPPTGACMSAGKDRKALLEENRRLRKENEYLMHRLAYMESLAHLMGFTVDKVIKKNDSKPSSSSSAPGGEET